MSAQEKEGLSSEPCSDDLKQKWILKDKVLSSLATKLCLDTNQIGQAYTLPCNGNDFQKWRVHENGLTIQDVATSRNLDNNYLGKVYTLPPNGVNCQNWLKYKP